MSALEQKLSSIETEIAGFISRNNNKSAELSSRVLAVEQLVASTGGPVGTSMDKSIGQQLIESEGFQALQRGQKESGKIKIESFHKAIVNSGSPSVLVPPMFLPGIVTSTGMRPLTVRDLLSQLRTTSNLVQFTQELVFTNNAGPQPGENTAKGQSDITFQLQNAPVQTLAHWIAASRQVLDDATALQGYINTRLTYGLKLVEETQLISGDGTGQNLLGLIPSSTAYNRGVAAGDTDVDVLRKAKTQVFDSYFQADGYVINPHDWERIELVKTTYGEYVVSGDPRMQGPAILWGLPVAVTPAIGVGKFLCGAFRAAASIWDRWDATIEVSREHQDFFVKNMVAILCEERLALTVFRPLALVYGTLPQTGS